MIRGKLGSRLGQSVAPRVIAASLFAATVVVLPSPTITGAAVAPAWKVTPSPNVVAKPNALLDVSCRTPTSCFAVGRVGLARYHDDALVVRGDGTTWSVVPNAKEDPRHRRLLGVACATATQCFAVGTENELQFESKLVVQQWDGTKMSVVQPKTPSPSLKRVGLFGIACASSTRCFAVGYHNVAGRSDTRTLVERWVGGPWAQQASPNPKNSPANVLRGVTCPAPTMCFAVGSTTVSGRLRTLVERWDGTGWSILPTPNLGAASGSLSSVSCVSVSNCFAVGYSMLYSQAALIEKWDGKSWTVVKIVDPPPETPPTEFDKVSCASASNCFAIGTYSGGVDPDRDLTLMKKWNGKSWSVAPFASPTGATFTRLSGIACIAASNCLAVGASISSSNAQSTLIERFTSDASR